MAKEKSRRTAGGFSHAHSFTAVFERSKPWNINRIDKIRQFLIYQKSPSVREYSVFEYELTNQLNTVYNSNTSVCAFADKHIVLSW